MATSSTSTLIPFKATPPAQAVRPHAAPAALPAPPPREGKRVRVMDPKTLHGLSPATARPDEALPPARLRLGIERRDSSDSSDRRPLRGRTAQQTRTARTPPWLLYVYIADRFSEADEQQQMRKVLKEPSQGLTAALAALEGASDLPNGQKAQRIVRVAIKHMAQILSHQKNLLVAAGASDLLDEIFGPKLAQRPAAWMQAALAGLTDLGAPWTATVPEAVRRNLPRMSMAQVERMADYLPKNLDALVGAMAAPLEPGWFGALMHACFTRLRRAGAKDGKPVHADAPALEAFFKTAVQHLIEAEVPAASPNLQHWAGSLGRSTPPGDILAHPTCSQRTRLKLFGLLVCFQDRVDDIPLLLLQARRNALFAQLREAAAAGACGAGLRQVVADTLSWAYDRHARRSLEALPQRPVGAAAALERFIEAEFAWLGKPEQRGREFKEARAAMYQSLGRFREALAGDETSDR